MAPVRAIRSALLFGVGTLVVGAAEAACAVAVYGAPGTSDGAPPQTRTVDADANAQTKPEAAPTSCYDESAALALKGTAPALGADQCTRAQVDALLPACLHPTGNGASCTAYLAANAGCATCLLGPNFPRPDAGPAPIGALVLISEDKLVPNVASCAALVIGRPDCALRVAQEAVCVASACRYCQDDPTCTSAARAGICRATVDAPCDAELRAREAEWKPLCSGASFEEVYPKVAWMLCGSPSVDGGLSDGAPEDGRARD